MNRGGKRNGGRNHRFFESLSPLQRALDVVTDVKKVSGDPRKGSLDSPALEDKLQRQADKLARRAKRAGHRP